MNLENINVLSKTLNNNVLSNFINNNSMFSNQLGEFK